MYNHESQRRTATCLVQSLHGDKACFRLLD
jgi:hypothetical protein